MLVCIIFVNVLGLVRSLTRKGLANSTWWRRMAIFCDHLIHLQLRWTGMSSKPQPTVMLPFTHCCRWVLRVKNNLVYTPHSSSPFQGDCQQGYVEFNWWQLRRYIRSQLWHKITSPWTGIYLYMLGHITSDMKLLYSLESQTISLTAWILSLILLPFSYIHAGSTTIHCCQSFLLVRSPVGIAFYLHLHK